jgi:hypothetical protein
MKEKNNGICSRKLTIKQKSFCKKSFLFQNKNLIVNRFDETADLSMDKMHCITCYFLRMKISKNGI